ncbi:MAG: hypothetical protein ACTSQ8_07910 [Candidatus Helarchaeota archaeon]
MAIGNIELIIPDQGWYQTHKVIKYLQGKPKKVRIILLRAQGTGPDAETEISPADNYLDADSNPIVVYVNCVNNNDKNDGSAVRQVTIIGIDENDELVSVDVATPGTSARQSSVTKFKRVFHFHASDWGSSPDADGNITLYDAETGGNLLLTISAGNNQSNGLAFTIPDGWQGALYKTRLIQMTMANNANATLIKEWHHGNEHGEDPDLPVNAWLVNEYNPNGFEEPTFHVSEEGEKIYLTEQKITSSESYFITFVYVIWMEGNS